MRPTHKFFAVSLAGALTIALLAVLLSGLGHSTDTAQATGGGAPEVIFDMDTTTAYPTVESCIAVAPGGSVTYDVVLDAVATGEDLDAYGYAQLADGLSGRVYEDGDVTSGSSGPGDGFTWTAQTHIGAAPYFSTAGDDLSEAVPDPPGSLLDTHGTTVGHIFTPGPAAAAGTVVRLGRYTLGVGGSTPSGTYIVQFDPQVGLTSFVSTTSNDWTASVTYTGGAFTSGTIGVGGCPQATDIAVTNAAVSAPAAVNTFTNFNVTVSADTQVLSGEDPTTADITFTLTTTDNDGEGGPDCPNQTFTLTGASISSTLTPVSHTFTNIQCDEGSNHPWTGTVSAVLTSPTAFTINPGDDSSTDATQSTNVTAEADLEVVSTALAFPFGTGIIVDDGFDNDGDTMVDELGEVPGNILPVNVNKTIQNNDLNDDMTYSDVVTLTNANPFSATCDVSASPLGPFTTSASQTQSGELEAGASSSFTKNFYLHCGRQGYGVDDDGDGLDQDGDGTPDVCIDEDYPNGVNDDAANCPSPGGGDTNTDEDGPVAVVLLTASDSLSPSPALHQNDPTPGNNAGGAGPSLVQGVLPFNPTANVIVDDANATDQTNTGGDDECVDTLPCRQVVIANIPGGNPLALILTTRGLPDAGMYAMTHGTAVTNGAITGQGNFNSTVDLGIGNGTCSTPLVLTPTLVDSAIIGEATDVPDATTALANPGSWSSKLNAMVAFIDVSVDGGAPNGYPALWRRDMGTVTIGPTIVPLNYLTFNLDPASGPVGPWLTVTAIGDPDNDNDGILGDVDPDDDNDGIPDKQDPDADGDGILNGNELSQCSPLAATTTYVGQTPSASGEVIITCVGTGSHTDNVAFTRADLGTTTNIPSTDNCKANAADMAVTLSKDETPGAGDGGSVDSDADTLIDEDTTVNGVDEDGDGADGEDPTGDIVASGVGQAIPVDVTVSLVAPSTGPTEPAITLTAISPAACNIAWMSASAGDTIQNSLVGPNKISKITLDPATVATLSVPANPSDTYTRKYNVSCPGGTSNLSFFANITPGPGEPLDPESLNNQAENHLTLTATNDVDGDGVPNGSDNCLWTANPGQTDTDGDGIGNACDIDDDGDGIPDGPDGCDLVAEDFDGVADGDGCPDTDAGVTVTKDEEYDVDVSTNHTESMTIVVSNGNYPAAQNVSVLVVSKLGQCEGHVVPEPGDGFFEFTTDEDSDTIPDTLFSQIEFITPVMPANSNLVYTRDYTVHCFQRSTHGPGLALGGIEIQVGVVPLPPVQEEGVDAPADENVHKNYPTINAFDQADLKKVGLVVSAVANTCADPLGPIPASINAGETLNLCVVETVHNNGPVAASGLDTLTITPAPDCSLNGNPAGAALVITTPLAGAVSVNEVLSHEVSVVCSDPSNHQIDFSDLVEVTELHVNDPNTANNTKAASINFAVLGTGDVAVTGVTTTPSIAIANVGQTFQVTVSGNVSVSGFSGANYTIGLSAPNDNDADTTPDCTLTPTGGQNGSTAGGPVSATWDAVCDTHSSHDFIGTISATPVPTIHVVQESPDPTADSGSDTGNVVIMAQVDLSVDLVDVPAVTFVAGYGTYAIPADVDTSNAGPFTPVAANLNVASSGGTCTASDSDNYAQSLGSNSGTFNSDVTFSSGDSCSYIVTGTVSENLAHVEDTDSGNDTNNDTGVICLDVDGDGVGVGGGVCGNDNCPDDYNPGQEDQDGDGLGDACDSHHDVVVKYITILGPAPVNLSDTIGRYMWVIGEIGNHSAHTEKVTISLSVLSNPAGCNPMQVVLVVPGQTTFLMLADEQKFVAYRVRFECHSPAVAGVYPLTVTLSIAHDDNYPAPGSGNDVNLANNSKTGMKSLVVEQP